MTPAERRAIQRLATSSPGRGRFYANPRVQEALQPPPQLPESTEYLSDEEDETDETDSEEEDDDDDDDDDDTDDEDEDEGDEAPGERKPKRRFLQKIRQIGSRIMGYLRRKGSSTTEDSKGRRRLTKRRLEKRGI